MKWRPRMRRVLSGLMERLNDDEKKLIVATEIERQAFRHLSRVWNVPINTLLSRKSRAMADSRVK
jgi:DNA-directed RNA polymerase specialized sigma24 family protein